jgi:hypothetical protein
VDWGLLTVEAARSHSDTPHSVRLLWTVISPTYRPVPDSHNTHNRQTSMRPVGLEPAVSVIERTETYALGREAKKHGDGNIIANILYPL